MNRRCDRCEFWHSPQNISSNYGDCRRNTPQRASSGLGGWPNTRPEQWCGEFSLRTDLEMDEMRRQAGERADAERERVAQALQAHRKDWPGSGPHKDWPT